MAKRRSRKRARSETKVVDDYGSDYRAQHMDGLEKEVRDRSSTGQPVSFGMRVKAECKLDAYWNRMLLTWKQYQAGMVIRRLYLSAQMQPRVTGSYGERIPSHGDWISGMSDAKKRLYEAVSLLPANPVNMKGPVMLVCCDDDWAGGTRKLDALRKALDKLADYFQIREEEAA